MLKRWHIASETIVITTGLVILKLLVEHWDLEFVSFNPLFTSIIGGGIFLFGLILAGTMADYKESEKIPAEIVSACESLYQEGRYVKGTKPDFDLDAFSQALINLVCGFFTDVREPKSRRALAALADLSRFYLQMELLGVPPNYIARLKSEESILRRNLLRVYYIQTTDFLPSAYVLVQSIVVLILVLLVMTRIEPFLDSLLTTTFLTYIFIYILKLLKTLDKPFRAGERTRDDVSLFLLREFIERVEADRLPGRETAVPADAGVTGAPCAP